MICGVQSTRLLLELYGLERERELIWEEAQKERVYLSLSRAPEGASLGCLISTAPRLHGGTGRRRFIAKLQGSP